MILPEAIYLEIGTQQSFSLKSGFFEKPYRAHIRRDTGCFYPVQPELVECEGDNQRQGFGHVTFAGMGRAAPIAAHAVLPDTASDISERYAADERVVPIAKDKKRITGSGGYFILKATHSMAKSALCQIVVRPSRLPRREKGPALFPQAGPTGEIAHHRLAQINALSTQDGRITSTEGQADHGGLGE